MVDIGTGPVKLKSEPPDTIHAAVFLDDWSRDWVLCERCAAVLLDRLEQFMDRELAKKEAAAAIASSGTVCAKAEYAQSTPCCSPRSCESDHDA